MDRNKGLIREVITDQKVLPRKECQGLVANTKKRRSTKVRRTVKGNLLYKVGT